MSARSPWLRGVTDATARRPWLSAPTQDPTPRPLHAPQPPPAAPAADACDRCGELEAMRAELAQARADAVEAGRAEGLAETALQRAVLSAATTAVNRARVARDQSVTELIVDVAIGLCVEMAPAAAAVDRRGLEQLVHRALAEAGGDKSGGAQALTLRMCAEDVAAMGGQLPTGVTCAVGADLVPGEVWVEAPRLVVDGRWVPRLAAMRDPLLALVRAAEPAFELATEESIEDAEEDDHGP